MLFINLSQKYIDYKMDFLIVTPKEIIKYDQKGVLSRKGESISADKIKTITIRKEGFLASFFDIGSLVFLAEGDNEQGDISFDDIDAVDTVSKKIKHIIGQEHV